MSLRNWHTEKCKKKYKSSTRTGPASARLDPPGRRPGSILSQSRTGPPATRPRHGWAGPLREP